MPPDSPNPLSDPAAKYRRLHESMTDAFVSVNMDGLITETNQAYRDLVGYTHAELTELTYVDLTPAKWHAMEDRIVAEQIIPRGSSEVYEKEYQRKDGTCVPVELRTFLIRDADDQPAVMWAIVRDVSERKQLREQLRESNKDLEQRVAEQTSALRESEQRFRLLSEATSEGIIVSCESVIIDANRQFTDMLGWKLEEVVGRSGLHMIAPSSRDEVARNVARGYEDPYELNMLRHDGTTFPAEARARMMTSKGRRIRVTALRDLTAIRRMERELAVGRNKIARNQRRVMLGEIGAGIAHQIGQPLCAMTNHLAVACSAASKCAEPACLRGDLVHAINEDLRHMRELVASLRKLSCPESRERRSVDLNDLVRYVLRLTSGARPDEPDIIEHLAPDLPPILGDPILIRQVVLNLINNAIESGSDSIEIFTKALPGDELELRVVDAGTGITPETLPKIFDLFFTIKEGGTGTGLAISRSIVNDHGGTIEAFNNPDAPGAAFRVTLPTGGKTS